MSNDQPLEPPHESWRDVQRKFATTAANVVTIGAAGTLIDATLPSKLAQRRAKFDADLAERLNRLEGLGRVVIERLENNDQFITAKVRASVSAVFTHQQEKRDALRNAVLNTAVGQAPDETCQQMFMNWIDELTPLHLGALSFFSKPRDFRGGLNDALEAEFPGLEPHQIYMVVVSDLGNRGLVELEKPGSVNYRKLGHSCITPLGSDFLSFIRDPLDSEAPLTP